MKRQRARVPPPVTVAECLVPSFEELLAHIAVQLLESLKQQGSVAVNDDDIGEVEYDFDDDRLTVRVGNDTHSVHVADFLARQSSKPN